VPVPIVAIGLGMAGGVVFEYVTSAGKPTKKGLAVSALTGALPVGLGFRAGAKGVSKARHLGKWRKAHGSKSAAAAAGQPAHRFPGLSLRPEAAAIGSGVAANVVVGMAYESFTHSSSGAETRSDPGSTTTQRSRGYGPYSSQRTRRSAPSGRRRKRCTHRDKRGRRCLRPAGHSGRHRYQ
jgi:hypothetical protein